MLHAGVQRRLQQPALMRQVWPSSKVCMPTTARSWHQTEQAVSEGISIKANMATHSAAERL